MSKQQILDFVKSNCVKSSCLMCKTADKHGGYTKCPFLNLKQKAIEGNISIKDISDGG